MAVVVVEVLVEAVVVARVVLRAGEDEVTAVLGDTVTVVGGPSLVRLVLVSEVVVSVYATEVSAQHSCALRI